MECKVILENGKVGETPIEMGGLVYLEGSALLGKKMEAEFAINNKNLSPEERISAYNKNMTEGGWVGKDLGAMAEKFNTRWSGVLKRFREHTGSLTLAAQ